MPVASVDYGVLALALAIVCVSVGGILVDVAGRLWRSDYATVLRIRRQLRGK